jgi:hypothetical protein
MKTLFTTARFVCLLVITLLAGAAQKSTAQCYGPELYFQNPSLVSGTHGQPGATYRFPFVTPDADALIRIDSVIGGATLTNIDGTHMGFMHAWQPVITGPSNVVGHEFYIRWTITFVAPGTSTPKNVNCLKFSAIDVDEDNVKIQDVVETYNALGYDMLPTSKVSVYHFNTPSGASTKAIGNHENDRQNIDTTAVNTQINFSYGNTSSVVIKTGILVNKTSSPNSQEERIYSIFYKNPFNLSTLPVRLLSFSGRAVDNGRIELKWVTEIEINNKQFELQRSFDGRDFTTVAVVLSLDGSGTKAYSYKDALPAGAPSKVFYRIKQIDTDNKYSISNIITVNSARDNSVGMKISPNPVASDFAINLENNQQGAYALRIMDISGREVFRQSLNGQKLPVIRLSASQARMDAPGIYVAELVFQDGSRLTQKMIRQ